MSRPRITRIRFRNPGVPVNRLVHSVHFVHHLFVRLHGQSMNSNFQAVRALAQGAGWLWSYAWDESPASLSASSSHSSYQAENVSGSPADDSSGERPVFSARPSRHSCPASSPLTTSQIRNAHPMWHTGMAPSTREEFQYFSLKRSSCLSYSASSFSSRSSLGFPPGHSMPS